MSIQTQQTKVNQVNKQIADLLKKENEEKKKQLNLISKINDLTSRALKSKSSSTMQSYQRQSESKQKELIRVEKNLTDVAKKLATKRAELARAETQLRKEIEKDNNKKADAEKKRFDQERKLIQEREQANRNQLSQLRNINNEIRTQQNLFSQYIYQYQDEISTDKGGYEIDELVELNKRVDKVLDELNKLGLGQSILFDEIEELKGKGKKISKKDLKLLLIGKIVSFGMKTIDTETAQEVFETITGVDMGKLLE